MRNLLLFFGNAEATDLRPSEIEDYRRSRRRMLTNRGTPPAHSTINRELTYLQAALRRAERLEVISRVPTIRKVRERSRRADWCPRSVLEKIIEYLEPRHPVVADVVLTLFHTGWRKSEVLGLTWESVSLEVAEFRIWSSKSGHARVFPIEGELVDVFSRRWRDRDGPYCFHRDGKRRRDFRKAWRSAVRYAGAEGLLVHGLRRTFATYQGLAGVPSFVTRALAGWRTDSIYRTYQITTGHMLRDGVRQSQRFIEQRG